jgi:hypothetical protein
VSEICVFERAPDGLVRVIPAVLFNADGLITEAPGMRILQSRLAGHRR